MTTEKLNRTSNGWMALAILIPVFILLFVAIIREFITGPPDPWLIGMLILATIINLICFAGLFTLEPNEASVLIFFGSYAGTTRDTGLRWTNPLYERKKLSLRARNFDSQKLKVNDKKGNPIEISAVVVWRIRETAQAIFDVDNYLEFVHVQAESAIRHVATSYNYDNYEGEEQSLRSSIDEVCDRLQHEIQERVQTAGVEILEARINHLAYSPEIAGAMLQRQQAEAIIAARQKIVDGAVGMVQMALQKLRADGIVELDEERKASMVSNLLVVLCSERATTPVVNTGSLY